MEVIRLENSLILATMLKAMYKELFNDASDDIKLYIDIAEKHIKEDYVFSNPCYNGFYIMKDITIPVLPTKRWDGVAVYIKPEKRNTKLLNMFYDHMFSNFEGDIIGFVEPESNHLKVLQKRHALLGYVYKLNRS